jgi:hypothetical protein
VLEEVNSEDSSSWEEEEEEPLVPSHSLGGEGDQTSQASEGPSDFSEEESDQSNQELSESDMVVDESFVQQVAEDDFLMQAHIGFSRCLSAFEIDGIILNEPDWYRWMILSTYIRSLD